MISKDSVWLAVGEEERGRSGLQVNVYCRDNVFYVYCIIKQLLDTVFVISRLIVVEVGVIGHPSGTAPEEGPGLQASRPTFGGEKN